MTQEMLKRWAAQGGTGVAPPHLSMGFNNTYIFLTDVLPRAIKKYGGVDAEALRKAALDTDIPIGGTIARLWREVLSAGRQDGRPE